MYRVLIADDEPLVLDSLRESIEWSKLGLVVAACASNGGEVLEIMEREKIDIAVLDIRMPGVSGLELCEMLRRKNEDIQLIIISGYAEFSYAERAIRYGVLGYCLKPLEYENVTRFLLKAIYNLQRGKGEKASGTDLMDALEEGEKDRIEKVLSSMGFLNEEFYVAVTVGEGKFPVKGKEGIVIETGRGQFGYFLVSSPDQAMLSEFLDKKENQGIGLEPCPVGTIELLAALDACTMRAFQFFVDPESRMCTETDEQEVGRLLGQIRQNIEKNRWEAVCSQLSLIEERYWKNFTVRSSIRLCNMIYTGSLFAEEENDYYIYSTKQMVTRYKNLSGMLRQLKEDILAAKSGLSDTESFSNTVFLKLMNYINENYKKDISLTSAGEALHMSTNYVSQLFKKETGITFIRYITQLRMEDAISLLTTTQMSAVEIAMKIGFNDYFYFLKTFKKFTGKTPTQYREEN